jgi:diguanylate cyclase (GGDEF)-like protein
LSSTGFLLAVILLQQTFFGLLWVAAAWLRLAAKSAAHWGAAALTVAVALTLVLRRADLSPWLGFFLANLLLLAPFMLLRRGLALFARQPTADAEQAGLLLATTAVVAAAVWTEAPVFITVTMVSGAIAWTMGRAAWQVDRSLRVEFGVGTAHACAAPLALVGAMFGLRAALAPAFREQVGQSLAVQTGFNTTLVFLFLGLGLLLNATLASMVVVRLVRRLEHSSDHDQLTGLLNRRGMMRILERESMRHQRFGQGYALLLLDVDHFKSVNDRYGHAVGDEVLVAVSAALQSASREVDRVARMGGEEFSVLLPSTDLAGAEQVARRMLESVRAVRLPPLAPDHEITVSVGVGVIGGPDDSLDELQRRIDRALYAAKAGGRDRVELSVAPAVRADPVPRAVA